MPDSPIPLDYRTPPPGKSGNRGDFYKWLIGGMAVSITLWTTAAFAHSDAVGLVALIGLPIAKLVVGLGLIASRQGRYAGSGLLVSIPLGELIGMGICAASTSHGW